MTTWPAPGEDVDIECPECDGVTSAVYVPGSTSTCSGCGFVLEHPGRPDDTGNVWR